MGKIFYQNGQNAYLACVDAKYVIKSGDLDIGALREEGYSKPIDHRYLRFGDKPISGIQTEIAFAIIDYFFRDIKQPRNAWKKDNKLYTVSWKDATNKTEIQSVQLNYDVIARHLRKNGAFKPEDLRLPKMECFWLDKSIDISINFHRFDKGSTSAISVTDGTPQAQFGSNFPIKPSIDREGHIFSTFQPQLIKRIIRNRNQLVEESNNALHYDWVLDVRTLINDIISLLDITLTQLYIKAEYSPEPGWTFNKAIVGERVSRRLEDKLRWVRQITGNEFNYEPEQASLKRLKEVRNHFNHFDPPSFAVTIEEATTWINDVIIIGMLLVRLRRTIGVVLSNDLINFVLQREVLFNPEPAFKNRLPLNPSKNGYYTSVWPISK